MMAADAKLQRWDAEAREIVEWFERVDQLTGAYRTAALVQIARAPWFRSPGFLEQGVVGRIHHEAWTALKDELAADTLANRWDRAYNPAHRRRIATALRIDPGERTLGYATHPFRIVEHDGGNWIAGVTPTPSMLRPSDLYAHLDIEDVILWNPRTGEVRCDSDIVTPDPDMIPSGRLTVYGDGYAFFRAWVDRRAETNERIVFAKWSKVTEPHDGDLPGAFVADVAKVDWNAVDASVLAAGPGIDADALKKAIYRSARLPRVEDTNERRAA